MLGDVDYQTLCEIVETGVEGEGGDFDAEGEREKKEGKARKKADPRRCDLLPV